MPLAPCQPPDQEGIDRAEEDLAPLGPLAQAGQRVEQVTNLGAGEVGVEHQTRFLAKGAFAALLLDPLADRGADAALPDDGIGQWLSRDALPEDGRFALVGDADGRDIGGRDFGGSKCLLRRVELRGPDRLGIVLDVPGGRQDLRKLLLSRADYSAVAAEDD